MACRVRPGYSTTHDSMTAGSDFHCLQVGKYLSLHHNCGLCLGFIQAMLLSSSIRMCDASVFPERHPAFYIAGMDVSEEEKERLYFTAAPRATQTLS